MKSHIEKIITEYKNNIVNSAQYNSFINDVREYNGYIFKKYRNKASLENEKIWLQKLMDSKYPSPKIKGTYNQEIIVMEKIEGQSINDNEAKEHLYKIGELMANLHNIPIESCDWKKDIRAEYKELRDSIKDIMEKDILEKITEFFESKLEKIKVSRITIIHKDLRPENVICSNGKYYLLDFEIMGIGDADYDFTRILNLLNEKEIYQYQDFKNLIDGYRRINDIKISEEKWQLYNKFYAFRIYSKMLNGKINRSDKYERYLKNILLNEDDRVTEWIRKYNKESID